ncbi:transglycosylase domain-containing protein [Rubrobacter naiadicus]|uniref:transglycosylase domain-containing protein n=1 Tax=Rubrobacter naiadicus TaxID=1392641 RepID=UPI00235F2D4E|nr:transglycosylase domain-containing protein [Rubrobacter naiadicus]
MKVYRGRMRFVGARRRQKRKEFRKRLYRRRRWFGLFVLGAVVLICFAAIKAEGTIKDGPIPPGFFAAHPSLDQSSVIYDSSGHPVSYVFGSENRIVVPLSKMSPYLPEALIAIEDNNFYEFPAIDPKGIARAIVVDITHGAPRQGGSTLTEQLMKQLYIKQNLRGQKDIWRVLAEAALSVPYAMSHTKHQILQNYLNTVYFGHNAYGAQAASLTYFGVPANKLSLPQAATLAGLVNAPTYLDPLKNPKAATQRRNAVLKAMFEQHMISRSRYEKAVKTPLQTHPYDFSAPAQDEAYTTAVKNLLFRKLGQKKLETGGLKIYTPMKESFQKNTYYSAKALLPDPSVDPSAASAVVQPGTGAVLSLQGMTPGGFDLATQGYRQPGSAFKTFALAAAVKDGIDPTRSVFVSKNLQFSWNGTPASIHNFAYKQRGPMTLEKATEVSDDTVFVQLGLLVGLDNVIRTAHQMGITSSLNRDPSMLLGGLQKGVTVLEMASAYATLADGGVYHSPYVVSKVEQNGRVIWTPHHTSRRALTKNQAAVVDSVLEGVMKNGTPRWFHDADAETGHTIAGKPGISSNDNDAYFAAYTPQYSMAVWVGYPQGGSMANVPGIGYVYGESIPQEIMIQLFKEALRNKPNVGFPKPDFSGLHAIYVPPNDIQNLADNGLRGTSINAFSPPPVHPASSGAGRGTQGSSSGGGGTNFLKGLHQLLQNIQKNLP